MWEPRGLPFAKIRQTRLIRLLILIGHFYLGGMWFGVALRMNTKNTCI